MSSPTLEQPSIELPKDGYNSVVDKKISGFSYGFSSVAETLMTRSSRFL